MFHQFGSFAQYERELISQRTSLGRSKRLKLGLWPGGCAPFGYKLVDSKLQIVEKEAKLVRLMFELYLNKNLGVINIARYLNDSKIKTRQGRKWRFTVVHKILNNPTYIGCIVRGGERVTFFGLSSEKVSQYLKNVIETFARLDRQEKKKILMEVIHKIKVDSSKEVHLFLSLPRRISVLDLGQGPLGSTLHYGATQLSRIKIYKGLNKMGMSNNS